MDNRMQDTRERILEKGQELLVSHGYSGLGLKQLLESCGVPKGSFYHYFESKEAFGSAVIARYVQDYLDRLDAIAAGPGTGRERLVRFFSAWQTNTAQAGLAERCLVVKLAPEVADLSDHMRGILDAGVQALTKSIAAMIADGERDGSIAPLGAPDDWAHSLYALWLGSAVLAKLSRTDTPLENAMAQTLRILEGRP